MIRLLVQATVTVFLSVILSLLWNIFNPNGIPLIGDYSRETRLEQLKIKKQELIKNTEKSVPVELDQLAEESELKSDISLEEAYNVYESGGAIFIDTRKITDYDQGHIKDSINIYAEQLEDYKDVIASLPKEIKIITYCGGTDCDLSIELANYLVEEGFFDVKIFFGGWIEWKNAGYPVESFINTE